MNEKEKDPVAVRAEGGVARVGRNASVHAPAPLVILRRAAAVAT